MSKKRGYYIHSEGRSTLGVSKKIDMQMEEFGRFYDMSEIEVVPEKRNLLERVIGLFPTCSIKRDYKSALGKIKDPDFLYVRRFVCDRQYVGFWKEIKRRYPNCKIIVEIFTYPYDKDDFGKWNAWPFLIKEWMYRPLLKKFIDIFVTYSDDDEIFGIPTIKTTNGIKVDSVRIVEGEYEDNAINLLGVAYMQRHHGYERIIEGLRDYYKDATEDKSRITLSLVGNGPEKEYYQKLVNEYKLSDVVRFYPTMDGDELEKMYDDADIALISFGMYKLGIYEKLGALKSRECLAKGMLLASGCEIETLPPDFEYAYIAPNDASVVKMDEIVDFWKRVKASGSKKENAVIIRKFAQDNVSIERVTKPIIDYLERT